MTRRTRAAKEHDPAPAAERAMSAPRGRHVDDVTLLSLLPPGLSFRDRAEILADLLPQVDGAVPGEQVIVQVAENEALRRFLGERLMEMVSIDEEPVTRLGGSRWSATIAGTPLALGMDGKLSLAALDAISVTPFTHLLAEELAAASQLVEIERARKSVFELADALYVFRDMAAHPTRYAYNTVEAVKLYADAQRARVGELAVALHPRNRDQAGVLEGAFIWASEVRNETANALAAAGDSLRANQPGWHPGETYWEHEDEYYGEGGFTGYAGGAATEMFHFVGNVVSGGHMDRSAANARAYREGRISWEAYNGNLSWNYLTSAVQAIVSAAAGAQGARFATWALGRVGVAEAGAVGAATQGLISGAAAGGSGAMSADAVALTASYVSDDPYVRDYQRSLIGGPESWGWSALFGAALGGGGAWLGHYGSSPKVPDPQAHWFDPQLEMNIAMASSGQLIPELPPPFLARLEPVHAALAQRNVLGAVRMLDDLAPTMPPGMLARLEAELSAAHDVTLPSVYRNPVARLPDGSFVPPTAWGGRRYYGTDVPDAEAQHLMHHGLPARGPNLDLYDHKVALAGRAFRGTTDARVYGTKAGEQQGAALWAGEGGWVFEIDGTPSWNVADLLEGRVKMPDGTFRNAPMPGELEHAILAQVPSERIIAIYKVKLTDTGAFSFGEVIRNPNYKPLMQR